MKNEAIYYIRRLEDGKPVNRLVSLSEIKFGHSDGLIQCTEDTFAPNLPNWKEKLVGFCADGANVNLGQTSGVVAKLRRDVPHLVDIQCMAHRLELAILQVQKNVEMVKKINDNLHLI